MNKDDLLKHSIQEARAGQGGIALLFTLGILSLLLVIALTFASTMNIESKAAHNNLNATSVKLLAESTANEVLVAFTGNSRAGKIKSKDFGANTNTSDKMGNLSTVIGDVVYFDYTVDGSGIDWRYYYQDGKIFGRSAYVTLLPNVPFAGVDPITLVESGVDESGANEVRMGVNSYEVNVGDIDSSLPVAKFSFDDAGGEQPTIGWGDSSAFKSDTGIIDQDLLDLFFIGSGKDSIEAHVDDFDDPDTYYQRFDLTQTVAKWDAMTIAKIEEPAGQYYDTKGTADTVDDEVVATNNSGIDPLKSGEWTSKGDYDTADERRQQIIANLIDYCDSDSDVTVDPSASVNWITTGPKYIGLEKTPYINEVGVTVTVALSGAGTSSAAVEIVTNANVEVINMYADSLGASKVQIIGKVDYSLSNAKKGDGSDVSAPATPQISFNSTIDIAGVNANSYSSTASGLFDLVDSTTSGVIAEAVSVSVDDIKVTIEKVILKFGAGDPKVDYAELGSNGVTGVAASVLLSPAVSSGGMAAWFEVVDPRHNQFSSAWGGDKADKANGDPEGVYGGTLDGFGSSTTGVNSDSDPSGGSDRDDEISSDPANISTAFIRDAPMESLWELGAIHRAGTYQTLNLKKSGWGDSYGNGDGLILSWVKLATASPVTGDDESTNHKININNDKKILTALFKGITIGGTYADPSAGAAIDRTTAEAIANAIPTSDDPSSRNLILQTNLISKDGGSVSLGRDTDAKQEELVGKFINISEAMSSEVPQFQVLILTQNIRDNGKLGEYEPGIDGVISEQKVLATIKKDLTTKKCTLLNYKLLED